MDYIPIVAMLSLFIVAPAIVFTFLRLNKRDKNQIEMMRIKKEMLELEIRKEEVKKEALIEENHKYDRIIEGH